MEPTVPVLQNADDLIDHLKANVMVANQPRRGRQLTYEDARRHLTTDRELARRDAMTDGDRLEQLQADRDRMIREMIAEDATGQGPVVRPF